MLSDTGFHHDSAPFSSIRASLLVGFWWALEGSPFSHSLSNSSTIGNHDWLFLGQEPTLEPTSGAKVISGLASLGHMTTPHWWGGGIS